MLMSAPSKQDHHHSSEQVGASAAWSTLVFQFSQLDQCLGPGLCAVFGAASSIFHEMLHGCIRGDSAMTPVSAVQPTCNSLMWALANRCTDDSEYCIVL
jgi:hypothetical protein